MPRRLPMRPAKLIGNLFVLFVLLIISMIYYTYVCILWGPRLLSNFKMILCILDNMYASILLTFFHVLFFMLLWSFFQAMTTDPG